MLPAAVLASIIDAVKLLARTEGIFTEPAGGTTLACTIKLIESGRIPREESICVCITGNGLKTVEVMAAEGGLVQSPVINAKLSEFDQLVQQIDESLPDCQPSAAESKA